MKDKIIKIIHNHYNLSKEVAQQVAKKMIDEYDVSGPDSEVSEDAVIELTDKILSIQMKKALVDKVINRLSRLKYNIFSSKHPNKSLRGKLFKFIDKSGNEIELIKGQKKMTVDSDDLSSGDKKLYFPADSF